MMFTGNLTRPEEQTGRSILPEPIQGQIQYMMSEPAQEQILCRVWESSGSFVFYKLDGDTVDTKIVVNGRTPAINPVTFADSLNKACIYEIGVETRILAVLRKFAVQYEWKKLEDA